MPRAEGVTEEQEAMRMLERLSFIDDEIEVGDWHFQAFDVDMHPDYIHRTYPNIKLAVYVEYLDHGQPLWPHFFVGDEQTNTLAAAIALCRRRFMSIR